MNLIESMMENFCFMNHVREDDQYGGYLDSWTEGASFLAAVIKNSTTEAQIAERTGIEEIFTIVTKKTVMLDFHEVVKRKSDNSIFRVTSRAVDSSAPEASTVPIVKVTAEKWVLPT